MPVTRITRLGIVNLFLVPDDEGGLILIDTGVAGSTKHVRAAAERLGAPVRTIALTHAHGDHIGSLDALHEALPDAEVVISARDARLLQKDKTPDPGEPSDARYRGSYPGARTRPTRTFQPGERVGPLAVLAAPGHTPGHVAFLDPRDRTLYCGDAFSTLGGVATTAKVNPRFPLPAWATWHRPTELGTARSLRALDPARLAPGHGKVVERPGPAMDEAIAKAS
jgi:glyoxylase-like metal-dependent hydrolase (beta-lactamase superfamily II)